MEREHLWLRKHYRSAPTDGPAAKRTKFADIHRRLSSAFPNRTFNATSVSDAIRSVFPHTLSKIAGKSRQKHIFGIEEVFSESSVASGLHTDCDQLTRERELLERIRLLEERVAELEKEKTFSPIQLSSEFLSLVTPEHATYHGPDTISHFETFNIDTVIAEMYQCAPNLYQLLLSLGKTVPSGSHLEAVRVATALSILLKSHSTKVLGVQLLVTLMLLARSTSRQVKHLHYTIYNDVNPTLLLLHA